MLSSNRQLEEKTIMDSTKNKFRLDSTALIVVHQVQNMLVYWGKDLMCRCADANYPEWFEQMVDTLTLKDNFDPICEFNLPSIGAATFHYIILNSYYDTKNKQSIADR